MCAERAVRASTPLSVFLTFTKDGAVLDKFVLKFLADVLYLKKVICFEEFEDIMEAQTPEDLDNIVDKILRSKYNLYRRGEGYDAYA